MIDLAVAAATAQLVYQRQADKPIGETTMPHALWVRKSDPEVSTLSDQPLVPLADGAARLRVESFAVTANNVTYALFGDIMSYWEFFPASDDWGIVPVWGHAVVESSNCPEVAVGERLYGYLPTATHLDVLPGEVSAAQFTDTSAHRRPMSPFYNQYARLQADPEHDPANEDARMIFGPLFKTGFLIEAFYRRNDWFGAQQVVMTSASSKTALALAYCARIGSPQIRRIGLTAPAHIDFVHASGQYDEVLTYDEVDSITVAPSVAVDFAGNAGVLRAIHTRLPELRYSSTVGMTHVGAPADNDDPLPGPAPLLFFAPSEAVEAIKALGAERFTDAVAAAWAGFLSQTPLFFGIEHRDGLAAAQDAFATTLAGRQSPDTGIVIRL